MNRLRRSRAGDPFIGLGLNCRGDRETTVVRALESVADVAGRVRAGHGYTRLHITADHRLRIVDGLLTGLHEPAASHLDLLTAFLPAEQLRTAYEEAVREFGDDEVFVVALETDDVFRAERLHALRRITDAIAKLPEVRSVQRLTDEIAFRWEPEGEWIDVGRFIDEIPTDPAQLARLRERALADPLYRRALLSDTVGRRR